jgi:F420-non-reducing hydrogenase large subunit
VPTLTFPLSRIEGHAQVIVEVQGGEVISAHFEAMEFRGFEYFVQGVPAEQMVVIVPRICGVCSTAHHVAAVKALEDAYGVTPPPLALTIRELLLLGQIVQNQATSLFIFTMPDRLGVASIFQLAEDAAVGQAFEPASAVGQAFEPASAVGQAFEPASAVGQAFEPASAVGQAFEPASAVGQAFEPASVVGQAFEPASAVGQAFEPASAVGQAFEPAAAVGQAFEPAAAVGQAFEPAAAVGQAFQPAAVLAVLATRALQVRKAGTDLITLAGGQFIHPVKAVVGGVTGGIGAEAAAAMRAELAEALPVACDLFDYYWEASLAMGERIGTWGDDAPACYIAAVADCCPNYYGDVLRVMCPDGAVRERFPARDFRSYLTYERSETSYAGQTSYQGQVMRANSLARINMARCMGTPRADEYLARFQQAFGQPAHALMLFDLARGIELVYALERALEILAGPLDGEDTAVSYTPRDGEGYGLVEAPRGPLIHHYRIEHGLIAQAEFIIPTVHNVLAIERALRVAARRYVTAERVDMELERAVGRVVRAFDPCIACATH